MGPNDGKKDGKWIVVKEEGPFYDLPDFDYSRSPAIMSTLGLLSDGVLLSKSSKE